MNHPRGMMRPGPVLLLSTLLILLFLSSAHAAPQATPTSLPNSTSTSAPASSGDCGGFRGDTDTYGLGIRIGLYLQWITSTLAFYFVPSEAASMRGINNSFQIANFGGLLYITITDGRGQPSGALYAVECWIVLTFCLGGVFSGRSRSSSEESPDYSSHGLTGLGACIQCALWTAMSYYALWFVYTGMDTMKATPCSRYTFFFAKVDLFHWFRTFLKVTFTMSAVGATLVSFSTVYRLLTHGHVDADEKGIIDRINPGINHGEPKSTSPGNVMLSLSLVFFILSTELIIRWNKIQGVSVIGSTGQLLPIIAASYGFIQVAYKFFFASGLTDTD